MGGAIFLNNGTLDLRRMTFRDNVAQGGSSASGTDGENGGGGGFGGDSPSTGGVGAGGGFLLGEGGNAHLDGHDDGFGFASMDGAGGGAARGGLLSDPASAWTGDNLPGGAGSWGGGGGFSVGPEGGGGDAGTFGGGGGGSGGRVVTPGPGGALLATLFPGAAGGSSGVFGGDGGLGDGILGGRGGGGCGAGGAIFLRKGTLLMTSCLFTGNRAVPGQGAEGGLRKGGAVFVYGASEDNPFDLAVLKAQSYAGNAAPDLAEDPSFDNNDWYVAQTLLVPKRDSPLQLRYRLYRMEKALRWPVRP
jgi:hypothetical protein